MGVLGVFHIDSRLRGNDVMDCGNDVVDCGDLARSIRNVFLRHDKPNGNPGILGVDMCCAV